MTLFYSPKYILELSQKLLVAIQDNFGQTGYVEDYLKRWQGPVDPRGFNDNLPFHIEYKADGSNRPDLKATFTNMDAEMILQIAVDLGLETPDFIPSVATFRNEIKSSYKTASATFEKATRQLEQDPSVAIALANSALESIIKEILKNPTIQVKLAELPDAVSKSIDTSTLYELTKKILKDFELFPGNSMPKEFNTLGSSMLAMNQAIETIRSTKTTAHGKVDGDYVVDDSLYAYFVVNSVATVGLFLKSYYEKKFKVSHNRFSFDDDMPF